MKDQPHFRFNPNSYQGGRGFEQSQQMCDACSRPCVWRYVGNIYATESPTVCARCIADGTLGKLLNSQHFSLHDIELHGPDPELRDEVLQRTPGVASFNPFVWPVLDGNPLAFLGYGDEADLLLIPDVRSAIEGAFEELGWDFDGPSPHALIFKEVNGDRYRVSVDLD